MLTETWHLTPKKYVHTLSNHQLSTAYWYIMQPTTSFFLPPQLLLTGWKSSNNQTCTYCAALGGEGPSTSSLSLSKLAASWFRRSPDLATASCSWGESVGCWKTGAIPSASLNVSCTAVWITNVNKHTSRFAKRRSLYSSHLHNTDSSTRYRVGGFLAVYCKNPPPTKEKHWKFLHAAHDKAPSGGSNCDNICNDHALCQNKL